jgi:glycosyltransferase involved in cell wall biosynthesis
MNDLANPLVSVVIPSYNHGRFLGRALQSLLNQTYTNWEAIVIDNHSTDNTDEVMAKFADPRITYLKIHNDGVIAASRNAGIRAAKGEWIAFLDSDDWWTNDKLKVCFDRVDEKVDLIYHDLEIVSDQSRTFRKKKSKILASKRTSTEGFVIKRQCHQQFISSGA